MKQILYLTANGRLGTLKNEDKLLMWQDKLQVTQWWYADEAIDILNDGGSWGYNRGLLEGQDYGYMNGFESGYRKGYEDGKEGKSYNSYVD